MFNNNLYNLMRQIVEEHTSLWRIKDAYKKDAGEASSEESKAFWEKLEKDKEEHIAKLKELIKEELK